MTTTPRPDPPYVAGERAMLEGWLDYHRATLEVKCDGVPPERLAEATVPPSPLSLLGLVRHMAEVELFWFQRVLAGEHAVPPGYREDEPDAVFLRAAEADPAEVFAVWRAQCDRARQLAAGMDLDHLGARRAWGRVEVSVRWVYVHMIEEYARHNGHADLLRERLDGAVGE